MIKQFWHNLITEKSLALLRELSKNYKFTLIGGWAVYFYTHALKSKDIDIIVDFKELGKLKESFELVKNERLKKYEIRGDNFDVDIYVPHWSDLGLPLDFVMQKSALREGFRLPKKEVLLVLKLFVYTQRKASLKGKKDLIDILSLLYKNGVSITELHGILQRFNLAHLLKTLRGILETTFETPELGINQKKFSDFKKPILAELKTIK